MTTQWQVPVNAVLVAICLAGFGTFSCSRSDYPGGAPAGTFEALLEDHLASQISGSKVENIDGQDLATLRDLLINPQNGRIAYAVFASGGFLGLGKRLKAVPAPVLFSGTAKKRVVALDVSAGSWENAPRLKRPAKVALTNPAIAASINRYYAIAEETNHALIVDNGPITVPTPTGRLNTQLAQSAGGAEFKSARDFLGQPIRNHQKQAVGKIDDLLLDVSGRRPGYAIISVDIPNKDETFAVPLQLLQATDHRGLTLDANPKIFDQAADFDVAAWRNNRLSSGTIFRFGKRP
jgi:sporulation protein YlmC with PRC-barrel domain